MGWNDHIDNSTIKKIKVCPCCGKRYVCIMYPQTPGFRSLEDEICPHCGVVVKRSMEYEFQTEKTDE